MPRRIRPAALIAVLSLGPGLVAFAAPQAPITDDGTRVLIRATVTDKSGRLVTDLSKEEFVVVDQSKPRPILGFRRDVRPISLMLMLDRSGSQTTAADREDDIARQVINQLAPADRARVVHFSDTFTTNPADFTNDQALLMSIARAYQIGHQTRIWDAAYDSLEPLEHASGNRAVLLVSDGSDTASRRTAHEVMTRAQDRAIAIYSLGLWTRILGVTDPPNGDLRSIADGTGGETFSLKTTDDVGPAVARVVEGMRESYILEFAPAIRDGKRHDLGVRVTRPNLLVHASRSYLAGRPGPTDRVER